MHGSPFCAIALRHCASQCGAPRAGFPRPPPEKFSDYGLLGHFATAHRLLRVLSNAWPSPGSSGAAALARRLGNMQMYVDARTEEDGSSTAVVG